MRKLSLLITVFFLTLGYASAQSLKPADPYPLKEGINQATSDSFVGTHYWYFYVTPGNNTLKVRFKNPTTLYGSELSNNILTITVTDEKKTWKAVKFIKSSRNENEATFVSKKLDQKIKLIISVAPPNQSLLRMGGDYEIEATGDVAFDEVKSTADPIIRTYDAKVMHYNESYGATKFLPDGKIETVTGFSGTWKLFDSENRIYTVVIGSIRYSLQYLPGYGLVKPGEPNSIAFQELRR